MDKKRAVSTLAAATTVQRFAGMIRFVSLAALCLAFVAPLAANPLPPIRPGHPRLLFTDEQLAAAQAAAKHDPLRAALHQRVLALGEAELTSAPIEHVLEGPRLLTQSRRALGRVLTCALAYRLSGDTRFATRATREMLTAAAFPDWNPSHFLDVAEMSLALAVGYDWLHAQLSPEDRATIKSALLRHALSFARAAYGERGTDGRPADRRVWFVSAHHNWNQVCNGGLLAAALALADEEPALAQLVIAGAIKSLPLAMAAYAPDGAYPEGPGYWSYGTSYNVIALALLEGALGSDFGLAGGAPGFDRTALFRLHVQGPTGLGFNFADGGSGMGANPEFTWLATRFAHPAALTHSRNLLEKELARTRSATGSSNRLFALHAVWFPAATANAATAPLDVRFRGPAEIAVFRSAWNDPRALFAGFKAGRNDVNHSHLDLGSFVLEADGVRWAADLGPDNYNLPQFFGAKRWTYFRLINASHNTLTPGNALQDPKARAPITAFGSTPARAFAIADLSAVYPGFAQRWQRGIAVLERSRVLIQDEIQGAATREPLNWRLVTGARVRVESPTRVVLAQDNRTLRIEVLAPADATFATRPATPPTPAENQNSGMTVLTATATLAGPDGRIAVLLTPIGDRWPEQSALDLKSLLDWAEN